METKNIPDPIETLIKNTEPKTDQFDSLKKSLRTLKLTKKTKLLLIAAGILVITAIVLMVLQKSIIPDSTPTPTPVATIAPTQIPDSIYATDSAVLKLETDLDNLEKDLKSTSFRDSGLILPKIDMDVKFNVNN